MGLRWGIVGSGRICHDFVCAVQTLPTNDHEIVAVAARSLASAQDFAVSHKIPIALEGYEVLAKHSNIEIAYIGVINTQHLEVAKLMLDNGKHVLCEKPLTMNAKHTRELLDYAKSKKLFLMDGIWSRCFPVYKELKTVIESGEIGEVMYSNVGFGFPLSHIDRVAVKDLGGGTILDIGIYTLQFTQFVFKGLKPIKLTGNGFLNKHGVDESASAIIQYPENKMGTVTTSSRVALPNEALVVGTKGEIRIPEFWAPTKLITPSGTKEFELPKTSETFNFGNSVGLSYEAEECRKCLKEGLLESTAVSHAESLELAELLDAWRKEVGVVYPDDI